METYLLFETRFHSATQAPVTSLVAGILLLSKVYLTNVCRVITAEGPLLVGALTGLLPTHLYVLELGHRCSFLCSLAVTGVFKAKARAVVAALRT